MLRWPTEPPELPLLQMGIRLSSPAEMVPQPVFGAAMVSRPAPGQRTALPQENLLPPENLLAPESPPLREKPAAAGELCAAEVADAPSECPCSTWLGPTRFLRPASRRQPPRNRHPASCTRNLRESTSRLRKNRVFERFLPEAFVFRDEVST
jgi:hypothetical protein